MEKMKELKRRLVSLLLIAASPAAVLETVRSRCVTLHVGGDDVPPTPEARERPSLPSSELCFSVLPERDIW